MYAYDGFIIPVIMHCRTPHSYKFKRNLEFKLHDVNCKKQTVLQSIKYVFEGEDMQTQYNEFDELGYNDTNIDYEIQRQKAIDKQLCYVFIMIDPDEENFNIFRAINKIQRRINRQDFKKTVKTRI